MKIKHKLHITETSLSTGSWTTNLNIPLRGTTPEEVWSGWVYVTAKSVNGIYVAVLCFAYDAANDVGTVTVARSNSVGSGTLFTTPFFNFNSNNVRLNITNVNSQHVDITMYGEVTMLDAS